MAMKTLLVHLAHDPDCETRLTAAVGLAKQLEAHLITLFVATPVHLPPGAEGRGASAVYLQEARENARNKAVEIEALARKVCDDAGVSWRWVYGEADHLAELLDEIHHADLTIVNQVSFDSFEDRLMFQLPERLVIEAGGPVLVLPKGMSAINLQKAQNVLIAWTYSKEAIRALRDSLPILRTAQKINLITCGPTEKDGPDPAAPVKNYLERHGIKAEHVTHSKNGHAGEEILDTADVLKADLIVMGAYGHTSILDKLFGSASRYVIGHTKIPLFMSH